MKEITATELKKNVRKTLKLVRESSDPIAIVRYDEVDAIMVNPKVWHSLLKKESTKKRNTSKILKEFSYKTKSSFDSVKYFRDLRDE